MRPTLEELLNTTYQSLPGVVRTVIDDPNTQALIETIGTQYGLDEIDLTLLSEEVGYVLFKVTPINNFAEELVYNLQVDEKRADKIAADITEQIFKPIRKFLKENKSLAIDSTPSKTLQSSTANQDSASKQATVPESEDLNHHDILSEIESPTPSLKTPAVPTELVAPNSKVMSKEAQNIINSDTSDYISKTKAPTLQEAVGNMPDIGGFIPVSNPLSPSQKISDSLDSKLTSITKTPLKEVFVPKRIDPYREPAE